VKKKPKEKTKEKDKAEEVTQFTFEDKFKEINLEIRKRKGRWFLDSLAWFDFEDVEQIVRTHIYRKWDQWDQRRSLGPWINKIITNQMKNILRNNYSNFVRPCLNCPFNHSKCTQDQGIRPGSLCGYTKTGMQDSECPLYAKWERTKKSAYDIKMAVTIEHHSHEVGTMHDQSIDIESGVSKLHAELEKKLPPKQFLVYEMLYIKNMDEVEVARVMGYKTNEKGRKAGYKQIKNLKKIFKEKAEDILNMGDIIVYEKAIGAHNRTKGVY
jgi:hypothetical protein